MGDAARQSTTPLFADQATSFPQPSEVQHASSTTEAVDSQGASNVPPYGNESPKDAASRRNSLPEAEKPVLVETGSEPDQKATSPPAVENTLRQSHLSFLWLLWTNLPLRRNRSVTGRVAIFKSRWVALQSVLPHLPAIVTIITIARFFYSETYIGSELQGNQGQDSERFFALQMAAKLLELFVVFSLGCILFTALRHEIVLGHGVPMASLASGLNFSRPSFLWSQEMLALLAAEFSAPWKKAAYVACLILFSAFTVIVAPATASALSPDLEWHAAGGAITWLNVSEKTLFPAQLDSSDVLGDHCLVEGDIRCPSGYWRQLRDNYLEHLTSATIYDPDLRDEAYYWSQHHPPPSPTIIRGRKAHLACWIVPRSLKTHSSVSTTSNFTVVTMPHQAIVDAAFDTYEHWTRAAHIVVVSGKGPHRNFGMRKEIRAYIGGSTRDALVHARCEPNLRPIVFAGNETKIMFPDFVDEDFRPALYGTPVIGPWIQALPPSLSRPEILWFDPDPDMARGASLGAVVAVPSGSESSPFIYGCFVEARWRETGLIDMELVGHIGYPMSIGLVPEGNSARGNWLQVNRRADIKTQIRPSWAKYLNPRLGDGTNATVLENLLWPTAFRDGDRWTPGYVPHLEAVLALMTVNGMTRTAPYAAMVYEFRNETGQWWLDFLPDAATTTFGRPSKSPYVAPANLTEAYSFRMNTDIYGYAYTSQNSGMRTSMIILLAYLPVIVLFLLWSLAAGITSTSWDSLSELLVLALKSRPPPPEVTAGSSAGISSLRPLKERYWIAEDGEQLVFKLASGGKCPPEERVKVNVAYK